MESNDELSLQVNGYNIVVLLSIAKNHESKEDIIDGINIGVFGKNIASFKIVSKSDKPDVFNKIRNITPLTEDIIHILDLYVDVVLQKVNY
jgi:hypothetical protein